VPDAGVSAVVLNLTGISSFGFATHLTAHAAGSPKPPTSNVNLASNETAANLVVVPVGTDGEVTIYNHLAWTHVVADVVGWIDDGTELSGARTQALAPTRILDTRKGVGAPLGAVGPDGTIDLVVKGVGGVPATGVSGVWLHLTATGATKQTHVTAYPFVASDPGTSNLNVPAGGTRSNLVLVPLSDGNSVRLANKSGSVHLLADVVGYVGEPGADLEEVHVGTPTRVLDTRTGPATPMGPGWASPLDVGVPDEATAVLLNLTGVSASTSTHLSVTPGTAVPTGDPATSSVNLTAGSTRANLVLVTLGPGGTVSLFNKSGSIHVVVDVIGWLS
jgi:hypothetical protein